MCGTTARAIIRGAVALTATKRLQSSGVISQKRSGLWRWSARIEPWPMPALLTRMSISPDWPSTSVTIVSNDAGSARSARKVRSAPGRFLPAAASNSASQLASRSTAATSIPASSIPSAIALPDAARSTGDDRHLPILRHQRFPPPRPAFAGGKSPTETEAAQFGFLRRSAATACTHRRAAGALPVVAQYPADSAVPRFARGLSTAPVKGKSWRAPVCANINRSPDHGRWRREWGCGGGSADSRRRCAGNGLSRACAGTRPTDRERGCRNRAPPRTARGDRRGPGAGGPVSPVAAALPGRRRIAAGGLCSGHRGDSQTRRQHRLVPRPGLRLHDDRRLSGARGRPRNLWRPAWHRRLGAARPGRSARRTRRLSPDRHLELCQRQPSRELARRSCRGLRRQTARRGCGPTAARSFAPCCFRRPAP